jgi:hypothetical protein
MEREALEARSRLWKEPSGVSLRCMWTSQTYVREVMVGVLVHAETKELGYRMLLASLPIPNSS